MATALPITGGVVLLALDVLYVLFVRPV